MRPDLQHTVRGLYGIADSDACKGDPVQGIAHLLDGGCRLVQIRCKGWTVDEVEKAGREASVLCKHVGATFILNDHPSLVASCGADGVHIGQGDLSPEEARHIVGDFAIIGLTTNSPHHLQTVSTEIDYMSYGPIWDSHRAGSHKTTQGLEAFKSALLKAPPGVPVVAIGGIRATQIPVVRAAGASAWAVIGAVFNADDPVAATRLLVAV